MIPPFRVSNGGGTQKRTTGILFAPVVPKFPASVFQRVDEILRIPPFRVSSGGGTQKRTTGILFAPVAQLDRAAASGAVGRAFESRRAYKTIEAFSLGRIIRGRDPFLE